MCEYADCSAPRTTTPAFSSETYCRTCGGRQGVDPEDGHVDRMTRLDVAISRRPVPA